MPTIIIPRAWMVAVGFMTLRACKESLERTSGLTGVTFIVSRKVKGFEIKNGDASTLGIARRAAKDRRNFSHRSNVDIANKIADYAD